MSRGNGPRGSGGFVAPTGLVGRAPCSIPAASKWWAESAVINVVRGCFSDIFKANNWLCTCFDKIDIVCTGTKYCAVTVRLID